MGSNKSYWTGMEELHQTDEFKNSQRDEFAPEVSIDEFLGNSGLGSTTTGRRDFLKFLGFSLSAATLAACEAPVIKSIPYVNKPEDITPGVANWYASSFYDGNDFANILVKTREGRPIYIKGNTSYGHTGGALNARINSSVLPLYDSARLAGPTKKGASISWTQADAEIGAQIAKVKEKGGKVALLSDTIISPSTKGAIAAFESALGDTVDFNHVQYDAVSYKGIRKAHKMAFGVSAVPSFDFSKAEVVVSVAADFQGSWISGNVFTKQFAQTRRPELGKMSQHFQFESLMSLTGSNADFRTLVNPSDEGRVLVALYNHIAKRAGVAALATVPSEWEKATAKAAEALWAAKGKSLVVAGSNNPDLQSVALGINQILSNYGVTVDINRPMNMFRGDEEATANLVKEMQAGKVDLLLLYGVNPAYNFSNAKAFVNGLSKVGMSVSFNAYADETASLSTYILPDSHYLESWNDFNPIAGEYTLAQPTISPLFDTRQAQQTLLNWAGEEMSYLDFMKAKWEKNSEEVSVFADFWNRAVHNGSVTVDQTVDSTDYSDNHIGAAASRAVSLKGSGMEVVLYQKMAMGNGNQANNPWLQELPDPITKVTWDNYVTMAPKDVIEKGLNQHIGEELPASVVKVAVNGFEVELPVYPAPGQKPGTIGIALGYGRGANGENIGKAAYQTGEYGGHLTDENGKPLPIGKNVFGAAALVDGCLQYAISGASVESTGTEFPLACTQTHHTLMGRDSIVRETSLNVFKSSDKEVYNPAHTLKVHEGHDVVDKDIKEIDLWEAHPVENVGHRWGLSIDLSTCTGCSACITSCHSENNVPVVGKDEIRRSRDMHWLRLDRYFSSSEDEVKEAGGDFDYDLMEIPEENPKVVHMPMMCQHCNHAPCETVCPVAATTHSNEGLNQMTYNRCIGTRYCANNCPYKVRRFNWFNYTGYKKFTEVNPSQDELTRLVLNPDVVVRTRGVMEKCSMCVQKIQAGKLDAKKAGRPVHDGEIQTACSEACPTNAISFGDLNDENTENAKRAFGNRGYNALEEVGTKPNVYYMVKVRNTEKA